MDEGHTYKELYEAFKIYPSEITKWRKLYTETGSLKPQYRETRSRKIDKEKLQRAVEEKPDAYLSELAKPFDCTEQAVFYALKKLKITVKKKQYTYAEKSPIERALFVIRLIALIVFFKVCEFVYIDESGVHKHYQRDRGRARRGVRIHGEKPGKRTKKTNVIAGLCGNKHIAIHCYEHATTATFFEDWFEWELLGVVPRRSVIIMDNATFHRKKQLHDIAAKYGVYILFLPPYSPDFNKIELSWANLKRWLKDNLKRFPSLDFAIERYFYD